MSVTLLVGALFAQAAIPAPVTPAAGFERVDVAYEEMVAGRTDAAIARIRESGALSGDDPAALINLGTAYARKGMREEAQACFDAAAASRQRYELQLADGRWMDSRRAARLAAMPLARTATVAVR